MPAKYLKLLSGLAVLLVTANIGLYAYTQAYPRAKSKAETPAQTQALATQATTPGAVNVNPAIGSVLGATDALTEAQPTNEKIIPASLNVLVDKTHKLPTNYVPEGMKYTTNLQIASTSNRIYLREDAAEALRGMLNAMPNFASKVTVMSGYRSYSEQAKTYAVAVKRYGKTRGVLRAAPAGHSEHQLGTAVDLELQSSAGKRYSIYPGRPSSQWKWLDANAHKYGFVMSYRFGQSVSTGYQFEPWHWRYVGRELATKIRSSRDNPQKFYCKIGLLETDCPQ